MLIIDSPAKSIRYRHHSTGEPFIFNHSVSPNKEEIITHEILRDPRRHHTIQKFIETNLLLSYILCLSRYSNFLEINSLFLIILRNSQIYIHRLHIFLILKNQNEKVSKIGSYYVWEADVMVKIVDQITGKEA